ncbi:MAG: tetratricopeptide repeat protein [Rhodoferax sp.]|nr:tetratricopeptide repeat protein [Rhodoferax sp.]MDP3653256.1 tetratricopeptide repeat protein [Rhodoferax sp.]
MNTPALVPSLEERKLAIEIEKLALARRSFYIDLLAKIALPAALAAIAWATYATNTKAVEDRMAFDVDAKTTELRQKEDEFFLKKSDSARNRESMKAAFIQTNFALISSSSEEARKQADILARAVFSPSDIQDVLLKIAQIRESAPRAAEASGAYAAPSSDTYKASGMQFVKVGKFDQALQHFETATLLNPSDAEAWNFKAYTEMRVGSPEAALKSVSTSILLRPIDVTLQHKVVLNATKILCSLGRIEDAASYLNKSVAVFASLSAIAQHDGELQQRCHFSFSRQ